MGDSEAPEPLVFLLLLLLFFSIFIFYLLAFLCSAAFVNCLGKDKSTGFATTLWCCCAPFQLHLWYLGRDLQMLIYCTTCSFCGFGWCRDFCRMSDYVAHTRGDMWPLGAIGRKDRVEATVDGQRVQGIVSEPGNNRRKFRINRSEGEGSFECWEHELELLSPRFSWGRVISAGILTYLYAYLLKSLLPPRFFIGIEDVEGALDDNSSFEIYEKLCSYVGAIYAVYMVGNIGEQAIEIFPLIQAGTLGASASLVIGNSETSLFIEFAALLYAWRQNAQYRDRLACLHQSCCFRVFKLGIRFFIIFAISLIGLYNYGKIEMTVEGQAQKVEFKNLYATYMKQYTDWRESDEGKDFFNQLNTAWQHYSYRLENEGWENLFNEFSTQMFEDVGSNAAKTLGIDKDASCSEVKKQFRKLSRKYHPDKNPDDAESAQKYTDIVQAYEVMKERCSS